MFADLQSPPTDELIEKQGKVNRERQLSQARDKKKGKSSVSETVSDTELKKDTRQELSQQANVSEWKVRKAHKLRKEHPALAGKVLKGEMTPDFGK